MPMTCPSPARIATLVKKRLRKSILVNVIVGRGSKSLKISEINGEIDA